MINCLLVDDEPLALDILEGYIKTTPFLKLVARCSSAIEAIQKVENENIDLIFLDIQMPNLTGIEFSKMLINKKTKIIFTTAYEKYALESYRVNAIDYLLKPIDYSEFFTAANKAKNLILDKPTSPLESNYDNDYIFIKSDYKLLKISLKDIIYIEGLKDYVKFYTINSDKPILSLMSLKSLENDLTIKNFMRVHRSFIVNLKMVNTVERNRIVFGKKYIPISDKYKTNFLVFINSDISK